MIVSLTIIGGVARVVFSTNTAVSVIDRGVGVFIELDKRGHVVAARFNSHSAAVALVGILVSNYGVALTDQDKSKIISTF